MNLSKIALGLALAALTTACNQQQPQTGTAAAPATASDTTAAVTADIVYVNSDSLLTNYEYFKEVRTRLQGKTQKAEQNLRSQADAFQKEVQRFQQSAATMTQEQAAATEQRLMQKQQQLQALQQSSGNELMTEESEEMKKIYDEVEAYLQQISQDKGYRMVLTYSRGNSAILFGDSTLDITSEVVAGLNEQYKAQNQKEETKQ